MYFEIFKTIDKIIMIVYNINCTKKYSTVVTIAERNIFDLYILFITVIDKDLTV